MADTVLIDELHLTVRIPTDLADAEKQAVRRTLAGADFLRRLGRAVRLVVRGHPELARVRVSLTR